MPIWAVSLWYPDFMEKIQNHCHKLQGKKIYLSVGGKEANTKDPLMANVIVCTKETYGFLKDQNDVKYELNSGGHFADAGKRLAKGLRWMLEEEWIRKIDMWSTSSESKGRGIWISRTCRLQDRHPSSVKNREMEDCGIDIRNEQWFTQTRLLFPSWE